MTARPEADSRPGPPPPRVVGLTVVSTAAVIALLYYGEPLLVPLSFALFLSFALRPFVSLLERAGVPRVAAIILILFVMMGGVALLVINVTGQINQFFAELKIDFGGKTLEQYLEQLRIAVTLRVRDGAKLSAYLGV